MIVLDAMSTESVPFLIKPLPKASQISCLEMLISSVSASELKIIWWNFF